MESLTTCFVGYESSGKTALIIKILFDEFEETYAPTVEDSYRYTYNLLSLKKRNTFVHDVKEFQVDILDIGGSDTYKSEYDRWFSQADSFVFVYNISDEDSFVNLKNFRDEIVKIKKSRGDLPCILVGTHADEERQVTDTMGKKLGENFGCPFFETSSKADNFEFRSNYFIPPSQVIPSLLQEKIRRDQWKKLDALELPVTLPTKTRASSSPANFTRKSVSKDISPSPVKTLLEELLEKWTRPIDKLPVYIDFPRLASKVVIIVGAKNRAVTVDKSRIAARGSEDESPPKKSKEPKEKKKEKKKKKETEIAKRKKNIDPALAELFVPGMRVKFLEDPDLGLGTVRWKGIIKGNVPHIGVELDTAVGNSDGSYKGTSYFVCPEDRGVFVYPDMIAPNFKPEPLQMFTGGTIKSSLGEEWVYDVSGNIRLINDMHNGKNIVYEYTGEFFKPFSDSPSFGAGQWNGEGIVWVKKVRKFQEYSEKEDWTIFKSTGRDEFIRMELKGNKWNNVFTKTNTSVPVWEVVGNILKSTNESWEISGKVPSVIPMMLQCLRYTRFEFKEVFLISRDLSDTWKLFVTDKELRVNINMTVGSICEEFSKKYQHGDHLSLYFGGGILPDEKKISEFPLLKDNSVSINANLTAAASSDSFLSISAPSEVILPKDTGTPDMLRKDSKTTDEGIENSRKILRMVELKIKEIPISRETSIDEEFVSDEEEVSDDEDRLFPENSEKITLHITIKGWIQDVQIAKIASVIQLKEIVSQQATEKLRKISEKLIINRDNLKNMLSQLVDYLSQKKHDEAKDTVKLAVELIKKRVIEGERIASILSEAEETKILEVCDELRDMPRQILGATITIIKSQTVDLVAMTTLVDQIMSLNNQIQVNPYVYVNQFFNNSEALPENSLIDGVLSSGDSLETTLTTPDEAQQTFERNELRKKERKEEKMRQKKEEKKARMEKDKKWEALFSTLSKEEEFLLSPEIPVTEKVITPIAPPTSPVEPISPPTSPPSPHIVPMNVDHSKPFIGDIMREVLCKLSTSLGETEITNKIMKDFDLFVKQAGDTSRQLSKFLEKVLPEESKLCKVLKAINQSIIASPFIRLKQVFGKIAFEVTVGKVWDIKVKDVGGKWKILVHIVPQEEVWVIHQKVAVSKEGPPNGGFEFNWELKMRFDWDLKTLRETQLLIKGVTYQFGISESARKEVQNVVDNFYCK